MIIEEAMKKFSSQLALKLGKESDLKWDINKKGVVFGWCTLADPESIYAVAELVAAFNGRVMTISPLNTPDEFAGKAPDDALNDASATEKPVVVVINYHFYFEKINLTARITLPDDKRAVKSITPVLISADWHEREMQELFNIKLEGHPNSKRLFLDKSIHMKNHTMIPLSEAMNGASTNTLWEKIMKPDRKEAESDEQL